MSDKLKDNSDGMGCFGVMIVLGSVMTMSYAALGDPETWVRVGLGICSLLTLHIGLIACSLSIYVIVNED